MTKTPEHVVVVGAGFGGLTCAKALGRAGVRVTVVDRENHHLFQPLLYQVALAGLAPSEIAMPVRAVLGRYSNVRVVLGEVTGVDTAAHTLALRDGETLAWDRLVIATGMRTSYFGHDDWAERGLGLKSIDDALHVRRQVLLAFEAAEREDDPEVQRARLTFAIVGGGPTGVEVAGTLAELGTTLLKADFRRIAKHRPRILLVELGERLLPAFDAKLSARAKHDLEKMGVEVRLGTRVTDVAPHGIELDGKERVHAQVVVWAAGVKPAALAGAMDAERDKSGRLVVDAHCALTKSADVYAIGDVASFATPDGGTLPGLAPVALQQGRFVARQIVRERKGKPRETFRYVDKGSMATIGRSKAIMQYGAIKLGGFFAWLGWLAVHIFFLIGFRNRIAVMLEWLWLYVTFRRGARLITGLGDRDPIAEARKAV